MIHVMVEGTGEPQDFVLKDDGAALDGSGWTVDIDWRTAPSVPPTVAWLAQASGTVRVSGCESMTAGDYPFRFTLTAGGETAYVPNSSYAATWRVVPA